MLCLSACARPLVPNAELVGGPEDAVTATLLATSTLAPSAAPTPTRTPSPTPSPTPVPSPTPARLSLVSLQNLQYRLYSQEGWEVPLKDGTYNSGDDWEWR